MTWSRPWRVNGIVVAGLIAALALPAHGKGMKRPKRSTQPPYFDACFADAGDRFGIEPDVLRAIAHTESSMRPEAISKANKNGSRDLGVMQINSDWLETLVAYGITRYDLFEPCQNIHVGAWILAQNIGKYGQTWEAIGAYNVGPKVTRPGDDRDQKRRQYIQKVWDSYRRIVSR